VNDTNDGWGRSALGRSEGARQVETARTHGTDAVAPDAQDSGPTDLPAQPLAGLGTAPAHVAIIMDGNGRWAARRGLPRVEGHRRGVEAVRRAVRSAIDLGVRYLTIYSFSSENWRRPAAEVADLMGLLKLFVRRDLADLHGNNVRVRIIGEREGLSADIAGLLDEAEERTRGNTGLTLVVAFNYGGRQEILRAVRRLAEAVADGRLASDAIDVEAMAGALDTTGIPDPDLVIRTSGEQRLSNFLTWQTAYAEYVIVPEFWPDFDDAAFRAALDEYHRRDRRFGGLSGKAG
jgi:undecaprenyl diphosphate synthase